MFFDVELPRVSLISGKTPLERADNMSKVLGISGLYIKRDDCTGIGMGGNKLRKLEFLLADALQNGADTVVTIGGVQSNHTRLTAFSAKKMGLKASVILRPENKDFKLEDIDVQGNVLLSRIVDADIHFKYAQTPESWTAALEEVAEELREKGRKPYVIPSGGASPIGVAGYLYGGIELAEQLLEQKVIPEAVVCACGSTGTLAGLLLAKKSMHMPHRLIGISVGSEKSAAREKTIRLAKECADILHMQVDIEETDFEVYDEYLGEGYAKPSEQDLLGVKMTAMHEGILLDPVYTGRAMGGMIDLIREGNIQGKKPVVFIHTGGAPALFAFQKDLEKLPT